MMTTTARFISQVQKTDDCWLWAGCRDRRGYGQFGIKTDKWKHVPAHRYSYELFRADIPPNLELDHLCRNPPCVNPEHLEPVTHHENCIRGEAGIKNKIKTHCPEGHKLEGDNLVRYKLKLGIRECRTCSRRQKQEYKRRKRLAKKAEVDAM